MALTVFFYLGLVLLLAWATVIIILVRHYWWDWLTGCCCPKGRRNGRNHVRRQTVTFDDDFLDRISVEHLGDVIARDSTPPIVEPSKVAPEIIRRTTETILYENI